MAEEVTAASMGESIGLVYRAKDITPQLMQFQAADLARKSQERAIAKKEKKLEGDKQLERIVPYEIKNLNKKVQDDANKYMAGARERITERVQEDDMEGATKEFVAMAQYMNQLEKESAGFDNINLKNQDPSNLVIEDVAEWSSSTDPAKRRPTQTQVEQWNSLGIPYDPKTNTIDYRGIKVRNDLAEFENYKPDIEVFRQNKIDPIIRQQTDVKGQLSQVSQVYVPNDDMYNAHRERMISDNDFVANAVNRISRDRKMKYGDLALETQKQMILNDPTLDGKVTYEMVNKQIVRDDYDKNHKAKWIMEHTVDENMNPVPKATSVPKPPKDTDPKPNPTAILGGEHVGPNVRKTLKINYPKVSNMSDAKIIKAYNKYKTDPASLTTEEKKMLSGFQALDKAGAEVITNRYPTAQIQQSNDYLTLPSNTNKKLQKIDEIYFNSDEDKYYARMSSTVAGSGSSLIMFELDIPLKVSDLNALKNAAKKDKGIEDGLFQIDGNSKNYNVKGYGTIDDWIARKSGGGSSGGSGGATGTSSKKKITKAEFDANFAKEKAKDPNADPAKYKAFLIGKGYKFAF